MGEHPSSVVPVSRNQRQAELLSLVGSTRRDRATVHGDLTLALEVSTEDETRDPLASRTESACYTKDLTRSDLKVKLSDPHATESSHHQYRSISLGAETAAERRLRLHGR